jgi:hypothetical protein
MHRTEAHGHLPGSECNIATNYPKKSFVLLVPTSSERRKPKLILNRLRITELRFHRDFLPYRIAQLVQQRATGWMADESWFDFRQGQEAFHFHSNQTGSRADPGSCKMGTGSFSRDKVAKVLTLPLSST